MWLKLRHAIKATSKKWSAAAAGEMFLKGASEKSSEYVIPLRYSVVYNHLDLMLGLPMDELTNDS
jgi:ATP-dependent Lon protease